MKDLFTKTVFQPSKAMEFDQRLIGYDSNPILVIDNFLQDPNAVQSIAARGKFTPVESDLYPGSRLALSNAAWADCARFMNTQLCNIFFAGVATKLTSCFAALSLSSLPADKAYPVQRIPHFDTVNTNQLALVCYLSNSTGFGGTSFYRHIATGYESICQDRASLYRRALRRDASLHGLPEKSYISGSTPMFEQTATIKYKFNRAVIYRSHMLHSGDINGDHSNHPAKGRLTANGFIRVE